MLLGERVLKVLIVVLAILSVLAIAGVCRAGTGAAVRRSSSRMPGTASIGSTLR